MDFPNLIQTVGVPLACLMALAIAVWRSLTWLGINVIRPVAARHIKFLDELGLAMASQSQAMQTIALQQTKNVEQLERLLIRLEQIIGKQDDLMHRVASVTCANFVPVPPSPVPVKRERKTDVAHDKSE